jgi:rubrerythrin
VSPQTVALYLDKLGERLAFERTGVRVYESLLAKLDVEGNFDGGPERAELERFREQELAHLRSLCECVLSVGGDPTALTPSADLAAVMTAGVCSVVTDPRTTLIDCLHALLFLELADNDAWEMLVEIAHAAGEPEVAERFADHCDEEEEHLEAVRRWLVAAQLGAEPQATH